MDAQLSIETLLTAARLLDGGPHKVGSAFISQPLSAFQNTAAVAAATAAAAAAVAAASAQSAVATPVATYPPSITSSQPLNHGVAAIQPELRDVVISRKLRVEKKLCSASTSAQPYCIPSPPRKNSTKHSRAAHNELEKTRRANLRGCLETLKNLVPPIADASRNTTLALLTRARDHIKQLESGNAALMEERDRLEDQKTLLQNELERLKESTSQAMSRPSSAVSRISRDSPVFLEYSPSSKPHSHSPQPLVIEPVAERLLPALSVCYPRLYPYLDLNTTLPRAPLETSSFLPIHLRV